MAAVTDGAFEVTTMVTRSEYLAASFSRLQPWLAEGISRRTWERRRREITSAPVKGARAPVRRDLTANLGKSSKAPHAAVGPADHITPVPAHKKDLSRQADDLLIHRIHAFLDAQGMTPSDPQALAKAIHTIKLPEPLKHKDGRALVKVYRRARGRLPPGYDQWVDLIAKWDESYDRPKARDLVAA